MQYQDEVLGKPNSLGLMLINRFAANRREYLFVPDLLRNLTSLKKVC